MNNEIITLKQYDHLKGFFFALHCYYHEKIPTNFSHWANLLDDRGISWRVQNTVASLADKKSNSDFCLSTLLKQNNITVEA